MWINVRKLSVSLLNRENFRVRFKDRYSTKRKDEEVYKSKSETATELGTINFIKRKSNKQS